MGSLVIEREFELIIEVFPSASDGKSEVVWRIDVFSPKEKLSCRSSLQ